MKHHYETHHLALTDEEIDAIKGGEVLTEVLGRGVGVQIRASSARACDEEAEPR